MRQPRQSWIISIAKRLFFPVTGLLGLLSALSPASAQQVVPAAGGAGTTVSQDGDQYDISGGTQAGGNLFHEFDEFSLTETETANFLGDSSVFNIVGQVSQANPSYIDGTLQVSGSDANLYLVNPSGVLFGNNAQLSLQGSFTATTADQIEFDSAVLNVLDQGADYSAFLGEPSALHFTETSASAVVNQGDLVVAPGESISLTGGNVVNTGTLSAPGGEISLVAVGGESTVRYGIPGSLLSLELTDSSVPSGAGFAVTDLPALLTGSSTPVADALSLQPDGSYELASLQIGANEVSVAGEISTRATAGNGAGKGAGDGGEIALLGRSVDVIDAVIDASGDNGGNIRIGRDVGSGALPTSVLVWLDGTSVVRADGLEGAGGNIAVGSTRRARVRGDISARGTTLGGLVETSSSRLNLSDVRVDASGQAEGGRWLAASDDLDIVSNALDFNQLDPSVIAATLDSGTDIEITTTLGDSGNGDIVLSESIDQNNGGSADLTLSGRRFIRNNGSTIDLSSTGALTLGINQVNAEATPDSSSIESAIAAIGNVKGDRLISLGSGLYDFSGALDVNTQVEIQGAGVDATRLQDTSGDRLLNVLSGGDLTLRDLGLTKSPTGPDLGGGITNNGGALTITNAVLFNNAADNGGAIEVSNGGLLSIDSSTLHQNVAVGSGGGIQLHSGSRATVVNTIFSGNLAGENGGGIDATSQAALVLEDVTVVGNTAASQGGGVSAQAATVEITDSSFSNNSTAGEGGAIAVENSDATLQAVDIFDNTATVQGGGVAQRSGTLVLNASDLRRNETDGNGGAIAIAEAATTTLEASTLLIDNAAVGNGGGLATTGTGTLDIEDAFWSENQAGGSGGGLYQASQGALTIESMSFQRNTAGVDGGALFLSGEGTATINNVTINENDAQGNGGGLYLTDGGSITLTRAAVIDNVAGNDGGGLYQAGRSEFEGSSANFRNNRAGHEGGAIATNTAGGRLAVNSANLVGNVAVESGGAIVAQGETAVDLSSLLFQSNESEMGDGGALAIGGDASLSVVNTTFEANSAAAQGGAIYTDATGPVEITSGIFRDNEATGGGGAIANNAPNSTLSNNALSNGTLSNNTLSNNTLIVRGTLLTDNATADGGGAIYTGQDSQTLIENSQLTTNRAVRNGGGLYNEGSLTVNNTVLSSNRAGSSGGGLYSLSDARVTESRFENNEATEGGGIGARGQGDLTLTDIQVIGNQASQSGGGIYLSETVQGEITGTLSVDADGLATAATTQLENNVAGFDGGGLEVGDNSRLTVDGVLFRGNEAVDDGGGIAVTRSARVVINNSNFEGNQAADNGGALYRNNSNQNTSAGTNTVTFTQSRLIENQAANNGGGLYLGESSGQVRVTESSLQANRATASGGGLYGASESSLVVDNSRVVGNQAIAGGGLYSAGDDTVTESIFEDNEATNGGGIVVLENASLDLNDTIVRNNRAVTGYGGGLLVGDEATATVSGTLSTEATGLTIEGTTRFEGNTAGQDGGAIVSKASARVIANGVLFQDNIAGDDGGGVAALEASRVVVSNSHFENNRAAHNGGGLYSNHFGADIPGGDKAVVDNSRFINNEAANGGGFYQGLGGTATVSDSLFRANQATAEGGGLYGERDIAIADTEIVENEAQFGGGILIGGDANLQLTNSTLEANRASEGGGLFNRSAAELINTTLSNNIATNEGGGIKNTGATATLSVRNSTLYENEAGQGGGILTDSAQATRVRNTIVAGNGQNGVARSASGHDVSGDFEDQGNNLIGSAEGSSGFTNSLFVGTAAQPIDPRLAPLADNGGPTRTHLLRSDSVAINSGRTDDGLPLTDQRGFARVTGRAADIGAVELDAAEILLDPVVPVVPTEVSLSDPTLLMDTEESVGELLVYQDSERFSDDESIRQLEQNFSQSFEDYWDLPQGKELSFEGVQAILRRAQSEYEVNSAVIYAAFVPEENTQEEGSTVLQFESEPSGDDLLNLSVVMPAGELVRYELPVTRREAERQVRMLRSTAADPEDNFGYQPLSQQLYQWLLAPLEADLAAQGIQNLMYALDQGLRTAPVTAMRDYNGFSLERYGISVVPNVSLMQADFPASVRRPTIAMGVSEFEVEAPLPAVPIELDVVKSTVPVSQTLLNENTTSDAIASIQALEQPGVLHLATHASFDTHSPDSSAIELWDGPLSMREFSDLDWRESNLELLILSACSTAMSSPNAELGFAGLAAAAGVDATVGSLWQVSDIGTLALMSEFYAQLESTPLRFEALRRAQLSLLNKETRIENGNLITSAGEVDLPDEWDLPSDATLDHPFFWSAFTMVGNPW